MLRLYCTHASVFFVVLLDVKLDYSLPRSAAPTPPIAQAVVPLFLSMRGRFGPADLAQLCMATARLAYDSTPLMDGICAAATAQLPRFAPRELTNVLLALAKVLKLNLIGQACMLYCRLTFYESWSS